MSARRSRVRVSRCVALVFLSLTAVSPAGGEWSEPPGEPDPGAAARQAFARSCGPCHAGPATGSAEAPVNFLNPAGGAPAEAIARCAERIAARLALWDWPETLRPRDPMPPADWLREAGLGPDAWRASEDRAVLHAYVAGLLALTGSSFARAERTAGLDYDALRPCLEEAQP